MKKLLIADFSHETDRFCPEVADMNAFQDRYLVLGQEIFSSFRGVKCETGAFIDVFDGRQDVTLLPVLAMAAYPSGPVTKESYDYAHDRIISAVKADNPDGILLCLHGAMVAEGHDDGEGDLLADLRTITGPDIPIVATLDLHANITRKMADNADALVAYENYPHTDMYETGLVGAKIMDGMLSGKYHATMGYHRIPYLLPMFPTELPEIKEFEDLCKKYESLEGVLSVRLAHGFYPADFPEMGMAVVAVTDDDFPRAQQIADTIGQLIWEKRSQLVRRFTPLDKALAMIDKPHAESGPLIIADTADNPGGGGLCDTTHILREILNRGITGVALAQIRDPDSVQKCIEAGVGQEVELSLGGMSDPAFSGGPLFVRARVRHITDGNYINQDEMNRLALIRLGPSVSVEISGNTIIITTYRPQPYDAEVFRHFGIVPERQKALVVKSAVHYRNSFRKFARKMVEVNLPGYVAPVPDGLPFQSHLMD